MYWYRNKFDGKERLWIDDEEFETITEGELRTAGLYPTAAQPAVDIERFIQRHMKAALDQHASLGEGIAGAIEFGPAQTKVFVSRRLTELAEEEDCPPGVRGRWRATMAHEAIHGLLHRHLFDTSLTQRNLFEEPEGDQKPSEIIKCSDTDIGIGLGSYDWREYQANRGMAALLMPRQAFCQAAREKIACITSSGQSVLPNSSGYHTLVRSLALRFEVSRQAASIRLKAYDTAVGIGQRRLMSITA